MSKDNGVLLVQDADRKGVFFWNTALRRVSVVDKLTKRETAMHELRRFVVQIGSIALCLAAFSVGGQTAMAAEEQGAGEAAGAGRLSRETETPPAVICGWRKFHKRCG